MIVEAFNAMFAEHPDAAKCFVRLLAIRGYSIGKTGKNEIGVYDDLVVRAIGDDLAEFQATTDPGRSIVGNPINPSGTALVLPGMLWFEFGLHKGRSALVQSIPFEIERLDTSGNPKWKERGMYGLNLHSGGSSDNVGAWSAGCIAIRSSPPWEGEWMDFFGPLDAACKAACQTRVPCLLVDRLKPAGRWSEFDERGIA